MAHTCCLARKPIDDDDRIQLQEEDRHLKCQLDLLMTAFRTSRDIKPTPSDSHSEPLFR
jgi:hypothetical protein